MIKRFFILVCLSTNKISIMRIVQDISVTHAQENAAKQES